MSQEHHIVQIFNSCLVSGPETLVFPNLVGFRHRVTIILLQETRITAGASTVYNYAKSFGYNVVEIAVKGRFDIGAIKNLSDELKKLRPTIGHSHGPKASLYALLAVKLARIAIRLVTTNHGVRSTDGALKLKTFEYVYEHLVMPYYDVVLTVCSSDRMLLIERGVSSDKLLVHLNGTDRPLIAQESTCEGRLKARSAWARDYGLVFADDAYVFGVVARLAVEKQFEIILRAFASFLKKRSNNTSPLLLLCFGSGPLESELKRLTVDLGLTGRVHWMGYRRTVSDELIGLNALLSLSKAEGLPINLIEAGWAGLPVLATAVDGVFDLIENKVSGILIDAVPDVEVIVGGLEKLVNNETAAKKLGLALQKRVTEQFSRAAWVLELENIYSRLDSH